jgi:hypothetical protein
MPLEELPETIGNLTSLKRFWICQTKVSELPDTICNLTALQDFNYRPGRIKELPEALCSILAANEDDADDKSNDEEVPGNSIRIVIYDSKYDEID